MLPIQPNLTAHSPETVLYGSYRATLRAFNRALCARDAETSDHSERVAAYALKLAQMLGLDDYSLVGLEQGALLHDIGKLGVPDAILRKPGPLTNAEQLVMRTHVEHGLAIVREIPFLSEARHVIAEHHERYDGRGYPRGLVGAEIHIQARIFAVADALDALLSHRPYRAAQSFEFASQEIHRNAGAHFDPQVVEAFSSVPEADWLTLRSHSEMRQFTSGVTDTLRARTAFLRLASC
ncbi:MAG: HD-GYP domain-containing protein [Blastocatellia bacterium]